MGNRKLYRKIAKENKTTIANVKKEMQLALDTAYKTSLTNESTAAYQNMIPRKSEIPTPDEFIAYAVKEIKGRKP